MVSPSPEERDDDGRHWRWMRWPRGLAIGEYDNHIRAGPLDVDGSQPDAEVGATTATQSRVPRAMHPLDSVDGGVAGVDGDVTAGDAERCEGTVHLAESPAKEAVVDTGGGVDDHRDPGDGSTHPREDDAHHRTRAARRT